MQQTPIHELTIAATGAIVARRCVGYDGAQSGAGEHIFGVAQTAGAIGDSVSCVAAGTAIVEAGGAIAVGGKVATDANGKVVAHSTGIAVGFAIEAASADGDLIEVHLKALAS